MTTPGTNIPKPSLLDDEPIRQVIMSQPAMQFPNMQQSLIQQPPPSGDINLLGIKIPKILFYLLLIIIVVVIGFFCWKNIRNKNKELDNKYSSPMMSQSDFQQHQMAVAKYQRRMKEYAKQKLMQEREKELKDLKEKNEKNNEEKIKNPKKEDEKEDKEEDDETSEDEPKK